MPRYCSSPVPNLLGSTQCDRLLAGLGGLQSKNLRRSRYGLCRLLPLPRDRIRCQLQLLHREKPMLNPRYEGVQGSDERRPSILRSFQHLEHPELVLHLLHGRQWSQRSRSRERRHHRTYPESARAEEIPDTRSPSRTCLRFRPSQS